MQCAMQRLSGAPSTRAALGRASRVSLPHLGRSSSSSSRGVVLLCRASAEERSAAAAEDTSGAAAPSSSGNSAPDLSKDLEKFTRSTAATFAPRASGKVKNPAVKGSVLYNVFEYQAWIALVVGGLLSFNIIFPTDEPSIARLMGMWSIWMFTIPSLRAKECTDREKTALNYLFLLVPLLNVTLPLVWKSFPFIFCADVVAVVGMYAYKGVWAEVYGVPLGAPTTAAGGSEAQE